MSFNRTESARFAQENQKIVGELHAGVDKALAEAASRGFAVAPGDTLATILAAGQAAKEKLVEGNAKIYDDRRKVIFEQDEFAMKLIVQVSKLAMELYAAELINALVIENAEKDALRDQGNADIIRLNAEVDKRQVAIIQARAEMERRITVLKAQLVTAEEGTLIYETALINAQIATAEKKLEIIDSIYQVLAAEELALVAENRRVETLTVLLAAERVVADIKKAMVPLYITKASARLELADAITAEIPVQKAIVELGYDRIDLESRKEYAAHLLRLAENELELAKLGWTRANSVLTLTMNQSRRFLQEYENTIDTAIMELKATIAKDGVDLRLSASLGRTAIGVANDAEIQTAELKNTTDELTAILAGLADRATSQAAAITSGKKTSMSTTSVQNLTRKISG